MIKHKKLETDITEIYCDFCKKNITDSYSFKCGICGRDCCSYHKEAIFGDFDEDYPEYIYCVFCYKIIEPYLKKIEELKLELVYKIDDIRAEYSKKCLEEYNKEK